MSDLFPLLIADDDRNDTFLLKRALKLARVQHPIFVVHDGQDAIDYLSGEGQFADRSQFPLPGLLTLDIKMPRTNGFEVLEWLRNRSAIRNLPVVITSSSKLQDDVDLAFSLGATSYLVKPIPINELVGMIEAVRKNGSNPAVA